MPQTFTQWLGSPLLALVAGIAAIMGYLTLNALFLVYLERKVSAWMQRRMGPTEVGPWGLLQTAADMLKLLSKLAFRTLTVRLLEDEDRVWTGASAAAFLEGDNINLSENDLPLGQHLRKFIAPRLKAHSAAGDS